MSMSSGVSSNNSDTMSDASLPQVYSLKTMCLAKKCVQMPSKEEHGFLLFCGLGARKWEVDMNCNSLTFKQAILNIYPRLRSVIGYNLYTVSKDKNFERIPEKVNTPKRIRQYLGTHFTGCLIIVPVSDIVLMEEKREHLRQIDVRQSTDGSRKSSLTAEPDQSRHHRSLCLICGKIEKTPGTGSFYKVMEETIDCYGGKGETIVKKLTDILGFNFESKKKMLASTEICKKCLRTTTEVVRMEEQLKRNKEELVSNFFTTISKFKKSHGSHSEDLHQPSPPQPVTVPSVSSVFPNYQNVPAGFPFPPVAPGSAAPLFVQSMQLLGQQKHVPYGNGIVQFYQPPPTTTAPYSAIRHARDIATIEAEHEKIVKNGHLHDIAPSEVESSERPHDEAEDESCVSPRPFDTQSYASTFSFRSCSSIRSKAEIKSFDEPISLEMDHKSDKCDTSGEKRKYESNETSPRSQTSPVSTSSPKSDSVKSDSPGPETEKERQESERMKPWKKRKIHQDLELTSITTSTGDKSPSQDTPAESSSSKTSEGDESPDCQKQEDQGNSDN